MGKERLVVEIGVEEIPAQYVKTMAKSYEENARKILKEVDLDYESLKVLYTPRRFALIVESLSDKQLDREVFVKGPNKKFAFETDGATPSKALIGFLNRNNKKVQDIIIEQDYVYLKYKLQGKNALELLPSAIEKLILSICNPNPMRWNSYKIKFIRPIRWVMSMFGQTLIPVHLECVDSANFTYGQRTLCDKRIEITDSCQYENKLEQAFVIIDQEKRKKCIIEQLDKIEEKNGFDIERDNCLLEEITNIVEFPTCAVGKFDEKYLALPELVIKSPLKEQQRYFAVYKNNKITNYFVFVRNGGYNFIQNVVQGNERVLRPRLEDAEFFFDNDLKSSLVEKSKQLSNVVFVEKAGSYEKKSKRVETIAKLLKSYLKMNISDDMISTTSKLLKADLISSVVREYTNIQGEVGAIFASKEGYDIDICTAIKEQYLPNYQGDKLPTTKFSAVISIADKLDTIFSLCAVGLKPTSSSDPYGLRRQILGVFLIALDQEFDIDFDKFIDVCINNYEEFIEGEESLEDLSVFIKSFFRQRLKVFLNEVKNYRPEDIEHVAIDELNIYKSIKKLDVIQKIFATEWFVSFINIYNRVLKLIKNIDVSNLKHIDNIEDKDAQEMFDVYYNNKVAIENDICDKNYEKAIQGIAYCGEYINQFMIDNLALCEDVKKKTNRLVFFNDFCATCGEILSL
mgnify:CR=1 FL=1